MARIGLTRNARPGTALRWVRANWFVLAVLLPISAHFLFFELFPIGYSFALSFCGWTLGSRPTFVGLRNWIRLLSDPLVWRSLGVTLLFALYYVLPTMAIGMLLALLVNRKAAGASLFKSLYFLPSITSIVILAGVWKWLFIGDPRGVVNYVLGLLLGLPVQRFFSSETLALLVTALLSVYKGSGYLMIYFFAGLRALPETVYEAARIDGSSTWRTFRRITLPLMRPTVLYVLIVSTIDVLQVFESSFILTAGGPNYATTTIVYQIYKTAFVNMDLGYASNIAYILFVLILAISLIQYRIFDRDVSYA